jgi:hypothetical protein
MNKRAAGIVIVLAAGAAVGLFFLLRPATPEETDGKKHTLSAVQEKPRDAAEAASKEPAPAFGTEEFKEYALKRAAKWLAARNRDAASLVALWDITGDDALLDEAAQKSPDDPRVCTAMINRLGMKPEALPWVERLIAAEPGNPAGLYWKAQILAGTGKTGEALEALRAATATKGKPDSHLRDRMVTVREAALASGATVREAAVAAIGGPLSKNVMPVLAGNSLSLLRKEIQTAKDSGDADRVADIAALGAASAEHLRLTDAPTLVNDLVGRAFMRTMLKELDPQTEFGSDGKTAATKLAELEAETAQIKALIEPLQNKAGFDALNSLTDAQVSEFADRFILQGELAAVRWTETLKARQ